MGFTREVKQKLKLLLILFIILCTVIDLVIVDNAGRKIVVVRAAVKTQKRVIYRKPIIIHKKYIKPRYRFTHNDIYLMAQLLCGDKKIDGDGEYDIDFQKPINYKEAYKVLDIVMNRVRSNSFPDTVRGVILQRRQFDVIPCNLKSHPSNKTLNLVSNWCIAYNNYDRNIQVIPRSHLFYEGNGMINITRRNY